jgi:uncharacterized protein YbaR (Trm112 family)
MATDSLPEQSSRLLSAVGVVCPVCRGALATTPGGIGCDSCGRVYPVRDGLPILIATEAFLPINTDL